MSRSQSELNSTDSPLSVPSTMLKQPLLCLVLGVLGFSSCSTVAAIEDYVTQPLTTEPWENFGKGANTIGLSTGWAFYKADAHAVGKSGVLLGEEGTDDTVLTPEYGAGLTLRHLVTDKVALGLIVEYRSFSPESLQPLSAELTADSFQTWHFIASSRYYTDPISESGRWRGFAGIDLSYIPEVPLGDVTVEYKTGVTAGFPTETVNVTGSDYWALGAVLGTSYQISDSLAFDMSAFYEYAITTGNATVAFDGLGGAEAELGLRPQGLLFAFGLTYAF